MAEIREPKGTFEAAGLTIEQVQEWLANPCSVFIITHRSSFTAETTGQMENL